MLLLDDEDSVAAPSPCPLPRPPTPPSSVHATLSAEWPLDEEGERLFLRTEEELESLEFVEATSLLPAEQSDPIPPLPPPL
jgi:hypothetical protein